MQFKWIPLVVSVLCIVTLVASKAVEVEFPEFKEKVDQTTSRSLCNTFGACTPSSRRSLCLELGDCEAADMKFYEGSSSSRAISRDPDEFGSHARSFDATELDEINGSVADDEESIV